MDVSYIKMILEHRLEILTEKLVEASSNEEKDMLTNHIAEVIKELDNISDNVKEDIKTGESECTILDKDGKKTIKKIETHYFDCACHLSEHTMRFVYDPEYNELYSEIYLTKDRFFTRVWHAIKHIFGYQCRYGSFGCWTLDDNDTERLITLLNRKNNKDSKESKGDQK